MEIIQGTENQFMGRHLSSKVRVVSIDKEIDKIDSKRNKFQYADDKFEVDERFIIEKEDEAYESLDTANEFLFNKENCKINYPEGFEFNKRLIEYKRLNALRLMYEEGSAFSDRFFEKFGLEGKLEFEKSLKEFSALLGSQNVK